MLRYKERKMGDSIDVYLGEVRIAEVRWHYRGGRNSMYCLFTTGHEDFFSKRKEVVLAKFEKAAGMKGTFVE